MHAVSPLCELPMIRSRGPDREFGGGAVTLTVGHSRARLLVEPVEGAFVFMGGDGSHDVLTIILKR